MCDVHGPGQQEGDLRLDRLDPDILSGPDIETWNKIRYRLVTDEMPPDDQPQPPHGPQQQVIRWLTQQLRAAQVELLEPDGFYLPQKRETKSITRCFSMALSRGLPRRGDACGASVRTFTAP